MAQQGSQGMAPPQGAWTILEIAVCNRIARYGREMARAYSSAFRRAATMSWSRARFALRCLPLRGAILDKLWRGDGKNVTLRQEPYEQRALSQERIEGGA